MRLPDSLADNAPGKLPPLWIKQSCPKTRTISLHIAKEARSGALDKGWKVPVRCLRAACCLSRFSLPVPTDPIPPDWWCENEPAWQSPEDWLFLEKQRYTLGSNCSPFARSASGGTVPSFTASQPRAAPAWVLMWRSLPTTILALKWGLTDGEMECEFQAGHFLWLLQGNAAIRRAF